ncbi:MAG: class I SAM-dependent methyltransferase [Candidatus Peribacteraceae bacterium]|jgi:demethylmenaquinone methyltransferase/2-methoxy-6-polyprenyl-1,4-benzoquinol methylase|nr:class I SAM-dependent methyltransferase [Candidatus Peribacteraceae bacterium]MDP7454733.1 class I SAM-dependent methyltransferase [Candidatus Peribacteraceae bacterium]
MNQSNDHNEYTRSFFKKLAPRYDLITIPLKPLRKKVVALSEVAGGMRVLDLACGTGEQSIAFAKAGCSVIGIDLSKDMLSKAMKKIKSSMDIEFLCNDASSIPFENTSFDISTISLGLHDMPKNMAISVLSEMKRVTKAEGKIIIVEHHKSPNVLGSFNHMMMKRGDTRYYPAFIEAGLESYLNEAGLQMEKKLTVLLGLFQIVICQNKNGLSK